MPRPSKGAETCRRLANGGNLSEICREPGAPCYDTIHDWIRKYLEFAKAYAKAKELQADYRHDEIVAIADDRRLSPDERAS